VDDLVQWLGQQLDEDERIARAATAGPWTAMGQGVLDPSPPSNRLGIGMAVGHAAASADYNETAEHIARHDPARVLREIDAKRQIIALHHQLEDAQEMLDFCATCDATGKYPEYPCTTLRLLALPYADRPGYREEWRP
jgi:hypothetical protein